MTTNFQFKSSLIDYTYEGQGYNYTITTNDWTTLDVDIITFGQFISLMSDVYSGGILVINKHKLLDKFEIEIAENTGSSLSNLLTREQFVYTAYSVVPNDHNTENYCITTNFQLMQIEADAPCRVRLYASDTGRANDTARAFGAAIDPYDGLCVDFVITTPNTVYNVAPSAMVFSESNSQYSSIYITTTNLDVTQKDIAVTLTYVNFGKVQLEIPS